MPEPAFPIVVGCGRSGTTLVRAMLDSHPRLAVVHESGFLSQFARHRRRYERGGRLELERLISDLLGHYGFGALGMEPDAARDALRAAAPTSVAAAFRVLYRKYASDRDKDRYGDKTPLYVQHLASLGETWPEARFVHVVRDGRDVALAYLDRRSGPNELVEAALFWRRSIKRGRRGGAALGAGRYLELQYEQLVEDPEKALRPVCAFLDIDYTPGMLAFHERFDEVMAHGRGDNLHLMNVARPVSRGLRDWRSELSPDQVSMLDVVIGDLLGDLGYERGVGARPRAIAVARARDRQVQSVARRAAHGVRRLHRTLRRGR